VKGKSMVSFFETYNVQISSVRFLLTELGDWLYSLSVFFILCL